MESTDAAAQEVVGGAAAPEAAKAVPASRRRTELALAGAALIWLAATLATAHASIVGNGASPDVALAAAAFALPNLIAASLVAGAAAGLLATGGRVPLVPPAAPPVRRLLAGLAAGTVLGGACAGLIVYGYGGHARVATLAVTVAAGGVLGGAAAALPRPVLAAGVFASLAVLVVGLVAGFAQPGLVGLLGAGPTLDSQVSANWEAAYVVGIAGGLAAGVAAFWLLRRQGPRAWPWFLLAGALPGLLLVMAELLTRTGGAQLLALVRDLSEGDRYSVDFVAFSRLRNAMVVLFVGGLTAMVAVGRTLRPADPPDA